MSGLTGARQVVLVTSRYKDKDNIIALAWHTRTSFEPELYAVSVGKTRFSCGMIEKSKCFCVNFMPASLKKEIVHCGSCSGRTHDKFAETKLQKEECEKINCPRIKKALAYAECSVFKEVDTGDHFIFIGKVLKSKVLKKGKRLYHIEGNKFLEA